MNLSCGKIGIDRCFRLLLCFTFLITTFIGQSQWKVFDYEEKKENVKLLLPSEKYLKDGYTFFGTSFSFDENVITKGYEPFSHNTLWEVTINEPASSNKRCLYFNLYAVNVSMLKVHVCENDSTCYEQKFSFLKEGYQLPFEWTLNESSKISNTSGYGHRTGSLPLLTATITLRDSSKPYKLVVGDAKVYEKSYVKKPSQGYFFYELTGKKENQLRNYIRKKFGNAYPLKQDVDFISFRGGPYNFELEQNNIDSVARQKATLQLIRYIFKKYPYYNEHALNEQEILTSIDEIIADSLAFKDKIALLDKKAKELHDGHFYFKIEKELNISSPLIVKRINGVIQIVGIRDVRLENKIDLGDKVYAINNTISDRFIDSLSNDYFGDLSERQELAISHLLEKRINSSPYTVTLEKPDSRLYKIRLFYDKQFPAPNKFRPEHFGFYRLEDNWAYLKINKWDKGDWIKFYNLKDSINNAHGIVFDLRGNPGGVGMEAILIASCFLKKPFVYSIQTYSMHDKIYSGETILKPNSFLNLSKIKVIILVDNKTACASESFAAILKKINGATIVGASKTGSSFSTLYSLKLPENINLFTNVLIKNYILAEKKIIEYAGIVPDIFVNINKYTDLYGYDDKVLKTAQKIIGRSTMYINYSHLKIHKNEKGNKSGEHTYKCSTARVKKQS